MLKIIKLFKDSNEYKLLEIKDGNFFEFKRKLFLKINERLKNENKTVCWNFYSGKKVTMNSNTIVYKSKTVRIKYTLELLT